MRTRAIICSIVVCLLFTMIQTRPLLGNVDVVTSGATIYVDDDASGTQDGTSWQNAFTYLQDALTVAVEGQEIRVAQGVYKPDQAMLLWEFETIAHNRIGEEIGTELVSINWQDVGAEASFHLKQGVVLLGGYAGCLDPNPNIRNTDLYETILSGDLEGNDEYGQHLEWKPFMSDNSRVVVSASKIDVTDGAIMDGFTIISGCAGGARETAGIGALYIMESNLKISNCRFSNNYGDKSPIVINQDSTFMFDKCSFVGNSGRSRGAVSGGTGKCQFVDCLFLNNFSEYGPGAIETGADNLVLRRCRFINNCGSVGGAVAILRGALSAHHCLFTGNVASDSGGAIGSWRYTEMDFQHCVFHGNRAVYGTILAIETKGSSCCSEPAKNTVSFMNSILWESDELFVYDSDVPVDTHIEYSNIKGGWLGAGNLNVDPLFVDPGYWDPNEDSWVGGDYHLKSQAGRWNPASETWMKDDVTSPCIDTGDPNSPIGGEPFPNGDIVNMGTYAGTRQASRSSF